MPVALLIVRDIRHAIEIGSEMKWERIAAMRFATPARDDVRAIERPGNFLPLAPGAHVLVDHGFPHRIDSGKFLKEIQERGFVMVSLDRLPDDVHDNVPNHPPEEDEAQMKLKAKEFIYDLPDDVCGKVKGATLDLKGGSPQSFPLAFLPMERVEAIHKANPQEGVPMYAAVDPERIRVWPIPREDFDLILHVDDEDGRRET